MSADASQIVGMIYSIAMVAIGLGFVIFVHELGHFLAAKACGVKAEKFYIGFDIPMPKILGWQIPSKIAKFQWGETEYGIGILPLGGYVKMLGQDDDPRKYKDEQARAKGEKGESTAEAVMTPVEPIPDRPAFDPRSYQAKSVPQRMLIISAGVIMNLIFAVLMGAAAYNMGVPYTPTIVGGTMPGGAAWSRDLRPGDKIIRIGADGYTSEAFRFQQDLVPQILLANGDEIELLVRRTSGKEETIKVAGTKREGIPVALLGMFPTDTTTIGGKSKLDHMAVNKIKNSVEPGDRIEAVDGTMLESYSQLQQILARDFDKPLELTLARPVKNDKGELTEEATEHKVTLPPQPLRSLGLSTKIAAIAAIRDGSPAEKAGLKIGDKVLSIGGQAVGDPFTLSQRMAKLVGKEIPMEVAREKSDGKSETLQRKITPELPLMMHQAIGLRGSFLGVEPLGIAVPVEFVIADVAAGGPADKAGLKSGDELVGLQFRGADKVEQQKLEEEGLAEQITLDQNKDNLVTVMDVLQLVPNKANVEVTFRRSGGRLETVTVSPADAKDGFYEPRGLLMKDLTEVRTAANFGEAMSLGWRETKEKLVEIGRTLRGLVTGRVSPKNLGSPIMIAQVAYMEASKGWPTLLIFLTFLSANLALVNFLPIPVLDGGHMVFLAAEGIRGKPVDEHVQYYALLVGAAMLLCLMVFVFSNDIMRLIS